MSITKAPIIDPFNVLEIARGNVAGMVTINKFGRSTNVDNGVATDIWDRANATNDVDIWVAPTQARTHDIVSSSASDDGSPVGVGARTIKVFGLTGWGTKEVSEDIVMNGTTNVPTANSYVIVHRMQVLTKGATSSNVGLITATAQTDGTVTAQINAGEGQTLMAIYGIPSTQTAFVGRIYGSVNEAQGAAGNADVSLMVNPEPDAELLNFITKHRFGLDDTGTSALSVNYYTPKVFAGPLIIKMQAIGGTNDLSVSAGFDLILVDN